MRIACFLDEARIHHTPNLWSLHCPLKWTNPFFQDFLPSFSRTVHPSSLHFGVFIGYDDDDPFWANADLRARALSYMKSGLRQAMLLRQVDG